MNKYELMITFVALSTSTTVGNSVQKIETVDEVADVTGDSTPEENYVVLENDIATITEGGKYHITGNGMGIVVAPTIKDDVDITFEDVTLTGMGEGILYVDNVKSINLYFEGNNHFCAPILV